MTDDDIELSEQLNELYENLSGLVLKVDHLSIMRDRMGSCDRDIAHILDGISGSLRCCKIALKDAHATIRP